MMSLGDPLTPEQAAISHAWQEMFQKAVHFDETIAVLNHWLIAVHGLSIRRGDGCWVGESRNDETVDIRRETYSQCLAAVLDHIAGREEGS